MKYRGSVSAYDEVLRELFQKNWREEDTESEDEITDDVNEGREPREKGRSNVGVPYLVKIMEDFSEDTVVAFHMLVEVSLDGIYRHLRRSRGRRGDSSCWTISLSAANRVGDF